MTDLRGVIYHEQYEGSARCRDDIECIEPVNHNDADPDGSQHLRCHTHWLKWLVESGEERG